MVGEWGVRKRVERGKVLPLFFFLSKRGKEDNMEGRGGGGFLLSFFYFFYCFYDSDVSSFHVNFLM